MILLSFQPNDFSISFAVDFASESLPLTNTLWSPERAAGLTIRKQFIVLRTEKDKRSAWLKWKPVDDAYAYNIYYGTRPDKLYTSIMVHSNNEYWLKTMDSHKTYYFTIESINENGVSEKFKVVSSE